MARPLIWWRLIIGLIAAALAPGIVLGLSIGATEGGFSILYPFVFFQLFMTVPTVALFGLPLVILYRKMRWESWRSFSLGGAAAGAASGLLMGLVQGRDAVWTPLNTGSLPYFAILGVIGALALRLIVYSGLRPR